MRVILGTPDHPRVLTGIEVIEIWGDTPDEVATVRVSDAYEYGYGAYSEEHEAILLRAQSDDYARMAEEARRHAHALAVDRRYTGR